MTLLTALGLWFGWVFTGSRMVYFGLDPSVLSLSSQDYLLRSLDALFVPLVVLIVAALAGLAAHSLIRDWVAAGRLQEVLRWLSRVFVVLGTVLFVLGIWGMGRALPFATPFLFVQISSGLGVGLLAYGLYLRGQLALTHHSHQRPSSLSLRSQFGLSLVILLMTLSLFWTASVYATALGRGRGIELAANLKARPAVVVYSKEDLLIEGPGVSWEAVGTQGSAYRFRYSGLRLLIQSGDRLFLLPAGWSTTSGSVIELHEDTAVRVEFLPGG